MAEEKKKKGFWSWLGFGKKEEPNAEERPVVEEKQPIEETPTTTVEEATVVEGPAVTDDTIAPAQEEVVETAEEELEVAQSEEVSAPFATAIDTLSIKVEEAETRIEQAIDNKIAQLTSQYEEKVEPIIEKVEAAAEQVVETVSTTIENALDTAEQRISATVETVKTQAEQVVEEVKDRVENIIETTPVEPAREESEATEQAVEFEEISATEEVLETLAKVESEVVEETITEEAVAEENREDEYQEKPSEGGFFSRLIKGLIKTKQSIGSGFRNFFRGKKIDDDLFEELEEQLLVADLGMPTTTKIINNLTQHATKQQLRDAELLYQQLKVELGEVLKPVAQPLVLEDKKPYVILMVGVNGVGKTTTIGKLARKFQAEGKSVMLAAGDTFRAAAVEQLQVWGERNNIPVVAQSTGSDSASVIFDAMQSAAAKGVDVLIADTAGRLQNKNNLMDELKKIVRVMKKYDEMAPHEIMLTLDAGTGQNAISQAKLFNEAVGLTGITLTKLDGTAKGGVIFAIADQFNIPIRYIGVGEKIDDLRPFNADEFIEALFAHEDEK